MADINFHQRLPYEVESLEIELPRGLRTHASRAIAGRAHNNCAGASKTYTVTVEPYARVKKAKEVLRAASRPTSQLDWYDEKAKEQGSEGLCDPIMEAASEDRSCFRRDRVRRFEVGRRFPVLVSPRLVPSWKVRQEPPTPQTERVVERSGIIMTGQRRASSSYNDPPAVSPRATVHGGDSRPSRPQKKVKIRDKERLELPTISMTVKKQTKKEPNLSGWKHSGTAEVEGLISNRKPANHTDPYDEPRATGSNQASHQRDRAMGSARATPVPFRHLLRDVQASSDSDKEDLQFEIAQNLERGMLHCEALKERYEYHRDLFQREKERKGNESPFDVAMRIKNERNREAAKRMNSVQASTNHNQFDLQDSNGPGIRFSLGFSKFRH
mmetsp:Transcript_87673/g.151910  ORF Transcript_87673/g.151910 Transcript_87673/m.151910 type:complete len:384 (-) Transcript_87673:33-1184(-)